MEDEARSGVVSLCFGWHKTTSENRKLWRTEAEKHDDNTWYIDIGKKSCLDNNGSGDLKLGHLGIALIADVDVDILCST